MAKKLDKSWTGTAAAAAGAAIGSAAITAALLYARKAMMDNATKLAATTQPVDPPETD